MEIVTSETQKMNSPVGEKEEDTPGVKKEDQEKDTSTENFFVSTSTAEIEGNATDIQKEDQEKENAIEDNLSSSAIEVSPTKNLTVELQENELDIQREDQKKENSTEKNMSTSPTEVSPERNLPNTVTVEVDGNAIDTQKEQEKENATEKVMSSSPIEVYPTNDLANSSVEAEENALDIQKDDQKKKISIENNMSSSPTEVFPTKNIGNPPTLDMKENELDTQKVDQEKEYEKEGYSEDLKKEDQEKEVSSDKSMLNHLATEKPEGEKLDVQKEDREESHASIGQESEKLDVQKEDQVEAPRDTILLSNGTESPEAENETVLGKTIESVGLQSESSGGIKKNLEGNPNDEEERPAGDGTEVPGKEANASLSTHTTDLDQEKPASAWPEKAVALKNFVREKSVVAICSVLRRFGKSDDGVNVHNVEDKNLNSNNSSKEVTNPQEGSEAQEVSQKTVAKSGWNPLGLIGVSHNDDVENKTIQKDVTEESVQPIPMKGTVSLYTRLGCHDCKAARQFLHMKRLRYVEINLDVYPSRKLELEKMAGSSAVPRVFFNEVDIGGLTELKGLDESGKLAEHIEYVSNEGPSLEAPIPPVSGEDDVSSSGDIDELAVIVLKMKNIIVVRDRFYRLRRFTNCFLGSEALDLLSEDQCLEREEAIEFGRKLACKLFLQHVLDENVFEDGNHLYRFLDHDPLVSQCQNIPRGIIEVKPKPITEISSRLRFLSYAIFEAYTSEDGKHVDYRSIHGSEEFARYSRITEELQRVDLPDIPREEKLSFFINLYNMMAIHAILVWGHPTGALERRKLLGDFKYVIGGCTYSLSAIHNGILRANQRPPYNFSKLFGAKDKRLKVALSYPEPLIHFALVCGNRSGPALRCYSPENIDEELMEAAHNFLRSGGLILDVNAKVASVSKILRWYSVDFGKNEVEVLTHLSKYLEPAESEALLELLADSQLKVVYQPYDSQLNN